MNTVEYKFKPGEDVFAVHTYPIGARIFEGKITSINITIKPSSSSNHTEHTFITYYINSNPLLMFSDTKVFKTREEAEEFKAVWMKSIEEKKENES